MAKQQKINGKDCRYYVDGSMWTCYDGKSFFCKNTSGTMEQLKIVKDSFGMKVVNGRWSRTTPASLAVATCFVKKPNGLYMVAFNDGNSDNCYYKNLSWVPYHYHKTTTTSVDLAVAGSMCTVNSSGEISVDGNTSYHMYYWKTQTGDYHIGDPFVYVKAGDGIHFLRVNIDDIMRDSGYVQGDDAKLTNPVILHRDKNWLNFATNNLEWCESTDPRYLAYRTDTLIEKQKLCNKKNPGKQGTADLIS
jgi:hypothetical protein